MESEARNEVVDQMVAITAADGDLGRRSCEELLRASDWNIEVRGFFRSDPVSSTPRCKNLIGLECVFQKAINLHYSAPTPSTPHRRQPSPARPASPRRTTSSSSYPPSPPNNRNQNTPIVARLGLGTVYGLFLPIRFVLRILIGFWYMLGKHLFSAGVTGQINSSSLAYTSPELQPDPSSPIPS